MNVQIFIFVLIAVFFISGIIWAIMKFASKVGVIVIPIIVALAAGLLAPEQSRGLSQIVAIAMAIALIGVGVAGTLVCQLHADLFDLERGVKKLKKKSVGSNAEGHLIE